MAQVFETIGAVTGASSGTSVTSGADGAWSSSYVELSASTSVAWDGFFVNVNYVDNNQTIFEIATGAVSSEVVIVDAFLVGSSNRNVAHGMLYFPIPVASGTRISVRSNSNVAAQAADISIIGVGTSQTKFLKEAGGEESLGFDDTSTTVKGTSIDPGTSANTKGVWVEIDASTADDVDFISLDFVNTDTSITSPQDYLFDIGTGVADSEVVVVPNIPGHVSSFADEYYTGTAGPFLVSISSGTRISVRSQSSGVVDGDRQIFVVAHTMKLAAAGGSATIVAGLGSFALSGQVTDLEVGHLIAANQGSFSLTGQDTILTKDTPLVASQGSFSLSGQDTTLLWDHVIDASQGSFTLSGQVTDLEVGHLISAELGSFTLTGQITDLEVGHLISAELGSFSLTGQVTDLEVGHLISATQGAFTFTGQDATLFVSADETISAELGSFVLSGQVTNLEIGHLLTASLGSFSLSGQVTDLEVGHLISAALGSYALTGQLTSLEIGHLIEANQGSFSLAGQDTFFITTLNAITADLGSFVFTGQDTTLTFDDKIMPLPDGYVFNKQSVIIGGDSIKKITRSSRASTIRIRGSSS